MTEFHHSSQSSLFLRVTHNKNYDSAKDLIFTSWNVGLSTNGLASWQILQSAFIVVLFMYQHSL